jgi:hypothetical protein
MAPALLVRQLGDMLEDLLGTNWAQLRTAYLRWGWRLWAKLSVHLMGAGHFVKSVGSIPLSV